MDCSPTTTTTTTAATFQLEQQRSPNELEPSNDDMATSTSAHPINCSTNSASTLTDDLDSGCFDCNICLDSAQDPIVTLCGHLYCWACIYTWLQVQSDSRDPPFHHQPNADTHAHTRKQNCPVCKAHISQASLIPLYARGSPPTKPDQKGPPRLMDHGLSVPPRPAAVMLAGAADALLRELEIDHYSAASGGLVPFSPSTDHHDQLVRRNVLGELVHARNFGSFMGLFMNPLDYSSSYHLGGDRDRDRDRDHDHHRDDGGGGGGTSSSRTTTTTSSRQEMQVDKYLNRVSIFLLCCILLCLLSF